MDALFLEQLLTMMARAKRAREEHARLRQPRPLQVFGALDLLQTIKVSRHTRERAAILRLRAASNIATSHAIFTKSCANNPRAMTVSSPR